MSIRELVEPYRVKLSREDGESAAVRQFIVTWSERYLWAYGFLGGLQVDGSWQEPAQHPTLDGLLCDEVEIETYGVDTTSVDVNQHLTDVFPDEGKLTVLYSNKKKKRDSSSSTPDEIADIESDYSAEMLTLKGSTWMWNEGLKVHEYLNDSDIQPYKVIPFKQVVVTVKDENQINEENFNDQIGTVNFFEWAGYPCETLLFMGGKTKRSITSDGISFTEGELRFGYKKDGWNKFWDGQQFSEIWLDDGLHPRPTLCGTACDSKVYGCSDFDDLITESVVGAGP